jgi:hypothetical protein
MGAVSKVQVKEGQEGGSAFNPIQKKKSRSKLTAAEGLSERRVTKVDYALKQIQLDKVSSVFIEELHNEIDILKGMVRILNRKTGRSSRTIKSTQSTYLILHSSGSSEHCQSPRGFQPQKADLHHSGTLRWR